MYVHMHACTCVYVYVYKWPQWVAMLDFQNYKPNIQF